MELATVNNQTMAIKEYKGQRVLTFGDIDKAHKAAAGKARKRFNDNRKRFIEGVDFFKLQPSENRTFGINSPNGAIVITESGYLMLAKSFTDELAWTVQRELVNCYFRNKDADARQRRIAEKISRLTPEQCDEIIEKMSKPVEYEQLTLETKEYHYFDKAFNGNPVLTAADVEHFTRLSAHKVRYFLESKCEKHIDYILLEGPFLMQFKAQNPSINKQASALFVVTKSGFIKLMKYYGCKADTPKCFIEEKKPKISVEPPAADKVSADECIVALNVLRYIRACDVKFMENDDRKGLDGMKQYYSDRIKEVDGAIKRIGLIICAG